MTTGAPTPSTRKRSRLRTFAPLGVAAWLVLEIWLLILVAREAGGLTVLALLAGAAVLGAAVVKRAGRRAFAVLSETLQRPADGAAPSVDRGARGNGFLMLAGVLLMLPGLISDVAGLLLLVPPVREALGGYAERALDRRVGDALRQARIHRPDGKVVQGEVIRDDEPPRGDQSPRTPLNP